MLNLAINARDAMPGGGFVTIETDNVTLAARAMPGGHGAGRLCAHRRHRFRHRHGPGGAQPRLRPVLHDEAPGSGSGLGLSQAYGFARQSGGGIAIQTQRGEGTTVTLWLPRASMESAACRRAAADAAPAVPDDFTPGAGADHARR